MSGAGDPLGELLNSHLRSLPDGSLTRAEVGVLCNEIERLGVMVQKMRPVVNAADSYVSLYDKGDEMGNVARWEALHDALVEALP